MNGRCGRTLTTLIVKITKTNEIMNNNWHINIHQITDKVKSKKQIELKFL